MSTLRTVLLVALVAAVGLGTTACKKKVEPAAEQKATQQVDQAAADAERIAADAAKAEAERLAAAAKAKADAEKAKAEAERLARESRATLINSLTPVYFDFDKYDLRDDTRATLAHHGDQLRATADLRVKIEGHCDENGSDAYNMALGEHRANAAKDYLVRLGIDAGRFETISYGKSQPVDPGHDESAWSKNRRCEFKALNP
jgi:peptidoglycan-associated lipoprotein